MEPLEPTYHEFTTLLTEAELHALAVPYGAAPQRERKVPLRIFFWLMVLSASQPTARGGLFQLAAFFVGALTGLFPRSPAFSLTKMALSKRRSGTSWYFFRAVYNRLLARYRRYLPSTEHPTLARFRQALALDSTVTRVSAALEKAFQSVHQGQAAVKLNVRFSLKNLVLDKLQATAGKRHDRRFRGITQQPGILYLFDLGYWAFARFRKIAQAKSFFVSRLKSSCDPLVVAVSQVEWQPLVGCPLSQLTPLLSPNQPLDVRVKLSPAKKSRGDEEFRLVGLFYEDLWRFYLTNLFEATFTPQVIYDLYRQRWSIELFFNEIKHLLHAEHLLSRTQNGIMVEIYSLLICHLLTRLLIGLAAQQTHQPIEAFSFSRAFDLMRAFLATHLGALLRATPATLASFFQHLVEAITRMGWKDRPPVLSG